MIGCYDLDDNLITVFNSYKDCARWFNTSEKCIYCYISRSQKGIVDKKRDVNNKKWYRLFKISD